MLLGRVVKMQQVPAPSIRFTKVTEKLQSCLSQVQSYMVKADIAFSQKYSQRRALDLRVVISSFEISV